MPGFPWDAVIGAAGNVVGGLLGGKKDSAKKQAKLAWKQQEKAWLRGPQLMMEGAQRAGLHPLAVLGGSWSAPGVQVVDGQSGWGDAIGSGLQAAAQGASDWRASKLQEDQMQEMRMQQLLENIMQGKKLDSDIAVNQSIIRANDAQVMESGARTRTMLMNARHEGIGAKAPTTNLTLPDPFGGPPLSITEEEADGAQRWQNATGEPGEWFYSMPAGVRILLRNFWARQKAPGRSPGARRPIIP